MWTKPAPSCGLTKSRTGKYGGAVHWARAVVAARRLTLKQKHIRAVDRHPLLWSTVHLDQLLCDCVFSKQLPHDDISGRPIRSHSQEVQRRDQRSRHVARPLELHDDEIFDVGNGMDGLNSMSRNFRCLSLQASRAPASRNALRPAKRLSSRDHVEPLDQGSEDPFRFGPRAVTNRTFNAGRKSDAAAPIGDYLGNACYLVPRGITSAPQDHLNGWQPCQPASTMCCFSAAFSKIPALLSYRSIKRRSILRIRRVYPETCCRRQLNAESVIGSRRRVRFDL